MLGWLSHLIMRTVVSLLLCILSEPASAQTQNQTLTQNLALSVNGTPITFEDLAERQRFLQLRHLPASTKDSEESLIEDRLKFNEAARNRMDADDGAIARGFQRLAQELHLTPPALQELLTKSHVTEAHVRAFLRTEIAFLRYIKASQPTLNVSAQELDLEIAKRNAPKAEELLILPVVFIVPRGATAAQWEARRKEAEAMAASFSDCWRDLPKLQALSEVAIAPSTYKITNNFPYDKQDELAKIITGHFAPFTLGQNGLESFAICARKPSTESSLNRDEVLDEILEARLQKAAREAYQLLRARAIITRF